MAIESIMMPQLGESVTEGTINTWLVKEGDTVNKYDPIAEIMTDKVNAEVPSSFSGTITEIIAHEGDTIQVGALMCYIDAETSKGSKEKEKIKATEEKKTQTNLDKQQDNSMKNRYSPAVLKMAQEHNIDLLQLNGTGRGGRITRKDMNEYILNQHNTKTETEEKQELKQTTSHNETQTGDVEIPVSGVRKAIADNMVRSAQEIPHAWMTVEVDVTDLVKFRDKQKSSFKQKEGYNLTYFSFFVHAVANALKEFPQLNSVWAGDKIIQKNDINISIAVAKDEELFVPVIKNADDRSIKGIAKQINDLAILARTGKLQPEHMQGGTITVNNTGSFGSIHSMGIINYPQAAILQVESIVKRPVIINEMFAARDIVNLSLSIDHRVLDGLIGGKFLAKIKQTLENVNEETTTIY
ncbi:dihydrolipoamide acetyltransferase family protein [Virgibacillus sp. W0181]|uniref:dihydrolipoamide acetyltransferase family protein n=1 Tax=Virgibacillus sp. W0181 TaxID=3391581 RepID=UPI003F487966